MSENVRPASGDSSWFVHGRFGLFIHWGLYALPARHEWVKNREMITDEDYQKYYKRGSMVTLSSGILIAVLGLIELNIITLLIAMCMLMFAPVLYGFKVWVKALGAREITIT